MRSQPSRAPSNPTPLSRNGPRRPGSAPGILFNCRKEFPPPALSACAHPRTQCRPGLLRAVAKPCPVQGWRGRSQASAPDPRRRSRWSRPGTQSTDQNQRGTGPNHLTYSDRKLVLTMGSTSSSTATEDGEFSEVPQASFAKALAYLFTAPESLLVPTEGVSPHCGHVRR